MSARKPGHEVLEVYRQGSTIYEIVRPSWEEPRDPIVLRSCLTRADADRHVEQIEDLHRLLMAAVYGS